MFRSLYSGVSGLNANLVEIDVIGNNIANANTIGFKSGRVTFSEMLTQQIRSASRPVSGGRGGTNPQQIGLGTQVGSIDTNFNQGNFRTTGIKTDLAIQGEGFFVLSDGESRHYTRAGIFGLDSDNFLVNPSTGLKVQGVLADDDGEIRVGALEDIYIDPSLVMPAEATTEIVLSGNLDAESDAAGTILQSDSFLVAAAGADALVDLFSQSDGAAGLRLGDQIRLTGTAGGVNLSAAPAFVVGEGADGATLQDLLGWIQSSLAAQGVAAQVSLTADGAVQVTNQSGVDVVNLGLSCGSRPAFNDSFRWPMTIAAGQTAATDDVDSDAGQLRSAAGDGDLLSAIYTTSGQTLGLDLSAGSTTIAISGTSGGEEVPAGTLTVDGTTTVADLLQQLGATFRLNSTPVTIDDQGQIVVTGELGTASALGDVSITEVRADGTDNMAIQAAFGFVPTQTARDQQTYSVATTAYDSLGQAHTISFTFEKVAGLNEWLWTAELEGGEDILQGGSGRCRFTEGGSISSWTFDDGASTLSFQPQAVGEEGAQVVELSIDPGDVGGLNGLTQFAGSGSLQSLANGYTNGTLVDFEIDQSGLIVGHFSNDTVRALGRIGLARFANPAGLSREADNTYRRSGNSGQAMEFFAGDGGTTIVPGTLETSNVDLAEQFTRLVVAQRAFQANARVITTGDEVMQELVSIIR